MASETSFNSSSSTLSATSTIDGLTLTTTQAVELPTHEVNDLDDILDEYDIEPFAVPVPVTAPIIAVTSGSLLRPSGSQPTSNPQQEAPAPAQQADDPDDDLFPIPLGPSVGVSSGSVVRRPPSETTGIIIEETTVTLTRPNANPFTAPTTLTDQAGHTWVVNPVTLSFLTVLANGQTITTAGIFESQFPFDNAHVQARPEVSDIFGRPDNRTFFQKPAAAAGVFVAAILVSSAIGWMIVLLRRHYRQIDMPDSLIDPHYGRERRSAYGSTTYSRRTRRSDNFDDNSNIWRHGRSSDSSSRPMSQIEYNSYPHPSRESRSSKISTISSRSQSVYEFENPQLGMVVPSTSDGPRAMPVRVSREPPISPLPSNLDGSNAHFGLSPSNSTAGPSNPTVYQASADPTVLLGPTLTLTRSSNLQHRRPRPREVPSLSLIERTVVEPTARRPESPTNVPVRGFDSAGGSTSRSSLDNPFSHHLDLIDASGSSPDHPDNPFSDDNAAPAVAPPPPRQLSSIRPQLHHAQPNNRLR